MPKAKLTTKDQPLKAAPKVVAKKPALKKAEGSVVVYSLVGVATAAKLDLPKEVFGAEVNKALLAQASRVYSTNRTAHYANTKTRGEVAGSTKKIIKQKGTGGARHGGKRAPIFVGGGIALGPKSRKTELELPKKMKRAALISALSLKARDQQIFGLTGLDKASGKTKEMADLIKKLDKKSILLVVDQRIEKAAKAVRNIPGITFCEATGLNVFEVLKHRNLILTKEAVEKLSEKLSKKESK